MQELPSLGLLIATLLQLCGFVMLIAGIALILRDVMNLLGSNESKSIRRADSNVRKKLSNLTSSRQGRQLLNPTAGPDAKASAMHRTGSSRPANTSSPVSRQEPECDVSAQAADVLPNKNERTRF